MENIVLLHIFLLFILINATDADIFQDFAQSLTDSKPKVDQGSIDEDINGAGICGLMAGCKILGGKTACYGPSGTNVCAKCQQIAPVSKRNIMRADFYNFDLDGLQNCGEECPDILFLDEMVKYMYLTGEAVARLPQGAVYKSQHNKSYEVPNMLHREYYECQFCDEKCYMLLRTACLRVTLLPHVRQWCLLSLAWIKDDIGNLKGPASYILFLAAKVNDYEGHLKPVDKRIQCVKRNADDRNNYVHVDCRWPEYNSLAENEERASLVAAAASSVLLAGNWFNHGGWRIGKPFEEFGFAIQHSLWLAIFAGRLRITLNPLKREYQEGKYVIAGTQTLCSEKDVKIADNYEGSTGTVYATLCTLFKQKKLNKNSRYHHPKMRYRPEVHAPHALGCVERTTGMIFIRPGDWINSDYQQSILGTSTFPLGALFYDKKNLTTIELGKSRTVLYPPSIAVSLKNQDTTMCEKAEGNGPNLNGKFADAGLASIGGICNWVPVW